MRLKLPSENKMHQRPPSSSRKALLGGSRDISLVLERIYILRASSLNHLGFPGVLSLCCFSLMHQLSLFFFLLSSLPHVTNLYLVPQSLRTVERDHKGKQEITDKQVNCSIPIGYLKLISK